MATTRTATLDTLSTPASTAHGTTALTATTAATATPYTAETNATPSPNAEAARQDPTEILSADMASQTVEKHSIIKPGVAFASKHLVKVALSTHAAKNGYQFRVYNFNLFYFVVVFKQRDDVQNGTKNFPFRLNCKSETEPFSKSHHGTRNIHVD